MTFGYFRRNFEQGTGYVTAFYWAITTLSTVGYGDITPATFGEKVFSILAELFGCVLFAMLIGTLGSMMVGKRSATTLLASGLHSSKSASNMTAAGRGEAAGGEGEQAAGGAERVHGRAPDPEGAQGEGAALHGTPLYDHQPQPTRLCNYMYSV